MGDSEPKLLHFQVKDWVAAKAMFSRLSRYVFRGHASPDWSLATSLERTASRLQARSHIREVESLILKEFQRRAHHYLSDVPAVGECLEWLALIQHYGGPTRLLDFTHSGYVAAFFAMENADGDAAVWAVDKDALQSDAHARHNAALTGNYLDFNDRMLRLANEVICTGASDLGVILVEPHRLNQRMSTQQGTFLMPLVITHDFETNLFRGLGVRSEAFHQHPPTEYSVDSHYALLDRAVLIKIVIPRELHAVAMVDLAAMNVTSTSLFGGLEGFARSLPGILREYDRKFFKRMQIQAALNPTNT
jgi:hypothetical protein